jgi:hypothetical protein
MVAGAQGSRHVIARDQSESEPIARRLMLLRIVLEVVPEVVGERVFLRYVGVEDAVQLRPFRREIRELEVARLAEADEEDTFAVLRHHALRINHLWMNLVAKVVRPRCP